jgi:hypothetical protein
MLEETENEYAKKGAEFFLSKITFDFSAFLL